MSSSPRPNRLSSRSTNSASSASDKSDIEASLKKHLTISDDNEEIDYLDSLSLGSSNNNNNKTSTKSYSRKKDGGGISKSSKRRSSTTTATATSTSTRGRKKDASNGSLEKPKRRDSRSVTSAPPEVIDEDYGEYTLNDDGAPKTALNSANKSMRKSAKKLFDKAVRAASPGRLRRHRSKSPGASKIRNTIKHRAANSSPTGSTDDSTSFQTLADDSPTRSTTKQQQRPKSPGRLKKRLNRENSSRSAATATGKSKRSKSPGKLKKRSESPGRLKKRSESPGRLKKRAQSPGRLKKSSTRAQRRPTLTTRPENNGDGDDDDDDDENENGDSDDNLGAMLDRKNAESKPKRGGGSRSVSSAPPVRRKPERQKSSDDMMSRKERSARIRSGGEGGTSSRPSLKSKSFDGASSLVQSHDDGDEDEDDDDDDDEDEIEVPLKEEHSYSDMNDELARYKVRRNKSMDHKDHKEEVTDVKTRRPESMMLNREVGRRGKQNSLKDLVQYKEEEIHSTSYFASNHVLINRERMKRGLRPLSRNTAMDVLARKSAEAMAESNGLNPLKTTYVGNVLRGETIRSIHRSTMLQKQGRERLNLLNPFFQDFGVGTCKGEDGMLYMCQLFSERLELALTDTVTEQQE